MGPGESASASDQNRAYELGQALAQKGWVVLTGGRAAGVMAAASAGASAAGGLTLGILPDATASQIAPDVQLPIITGLGSARNAINALSCHALVACGLGLGTVSEIALVLKAGKPVVLLPHCPLASDFFLTLSSGLLHSAEDVHHCVAQLQTLLERP